MIKNEKGGLTVETSLILPIFTVSIMIYIYIIQILYVYSNINLALFSTAGELASNICFSKELNIQDVRDKLVGNLDESWINKDCIKNGIKGISVEGSYYDKKEDNIYLNVNYTSKLPVNILNINDKKIENKMIIRGFSGNMNLASNKKFVYITKKGKVYHTNIKCSYLLVKKISVLYSEIDNYRNDSGGKYYMCKECADEDIGEYVYITKYGTAYHSKKTCSSITRDIKAIDIYDIKGRKKCEKCCKG